jgi:hypothetical protein
MKRMNVKAMVVKGMMIGLLAGAVAIAMPAKAQAQEFVVRGPAVAVAFEHPRYNYSHFDTFQFQRREAIRRTEIRHEERLRAERFSRFERFGR